MLKNFLLFKCALKCSKGNEGQSWTERLNLGVGKVSRYQGSVAQPEQDTSKVSVHRGLMWGS